MQLFLSYGNRWPLRMPERIAANSAACGIHGGIDSIENINAHSQIELSCEMRPRCENAGNVFYPQSLRMMPALAPVDVPDSIR